MSDEPGAATHAVCWRRADQSGAEYAELTLTARRLSGRTTAVGGVPVPYRMDLELTTADDFVTSRLVVDTCGLGWTRHLDLRRATTGVWTADVSATGALDAPPPGGDMQQFDGALDPDVELCPLLNTPPTLRHGLLDGGGSVELLMVFVAVPSLTLQPSVQRYSALGSRPDGLFEVRFASPSPDGTEFVADIVFDRDGIVVDYPGIATRVGWVSKKSR